MPDETRPDKGKGPLTERVVLRESDGLWAIAGRVSAASKEQAIRQVADGEPGKYRSVPLRSWQGGLEIVLPEKPKPESKPFE